jgi:tetratricopeptide (TPR) repeat protein/serine phosphatase RsbU (regulator of sigma subunit)
MKCYWLTFSFLLLAKTISFAQTNLSVLIQKANNSSKDSNLAYLYHEIGNVYLQEKQQADSAIIYFRKALEISSKTKATRAEAQTYELLGKSYEALGKREEAIKNYDLAQQNFQKIKDTKGVAINLNNIGVMYDYLGQFDKALEYLFKSATLKENIGNLSGLADVWNDIGIVYEQMNEGDKAIEYYQKSLKILEQINAKPQKIANIYNNIGVVLYDQKKYEQALHYFEKSLEIRLTINSPRLESSYANIANIYVNQKKYDEAENLYHKAYALAKEQKRYEQIANHQLALGLTKMYKKQYDSSQYYIQEGLNISEKYELASWKEYAYYVQLQLDSARGNYEGAFKMARKLSEIAYQKYKKEKTEQIAKFQTAYETERKENENKLLREMQKSQIAENRLLRTERENKERENLLLKQEQKIKDLENKRLAEKQKYSNQENELLKEAQRIKKLENEKLLATQLEQKRQLQLQFWFLFAAVVIIFLIAALLIALYRLNLKRTLAYYLLQEKNEEINQQKEEIASQAETLREYNEQVLIQNEELNLAYNKITDSIKYAERLQYAMVANEKELQNLFPDSFLINLPKDIVSGDFLWLTQMKQYKIVALADCTGHGVPGSMMTFLGISALNEIVFEKKIFKPHLILEELDKKIITNLGKHTENLQQSDGMDIVLLCIDAQNKQIEFAGAKNPLYRVRNGILETFPTSIYSLGFNVFEEDKHFQTYTTDLQEGDIFYICSDGFQDQFGGNDTKPKKFLTKNLKEMFVRNAHYTFEVQKKNFLQTLENWQGRQAQTDDILLLGFRYSQG